MRPLISTFLLSFCSIFEVEYDSTFCKDFGYNKATADTAVQYIVALSSIHYQKPGLCTKIRISHLEGFCDPNNDDYTNVVDSSDVGCYSNAPLDTVYPAFKNFWSTNRASNLGATAHLFYGKDAGPTGSTIGCAGISVLCKSSAYGVNEMTFSNNWAMRSVRTMLLYCRCCSMIRQPLTLDQLFSRFCSLTNLATTLQVIMTRPHSITLCSHQFARRVIPLVKNQSPS